MIIATLAMIALPKLSDASDEAREAALVKDLNMFRRQIELFKGQHSGVVPGQNGESVADQMTGKTDITGAVAADGDFGPYMPMVPTNPFTDSDTVEAGTGAPGGGDHAWYLNTDTGKLSPDDDAHKDL